MVKCLSIACCVVAMSVQTMFATVMNVTFDGNGGDPALTQVQCVQGSAYGSFPTVVREGYLFLGWFTEKIGGSIVMCGMPAGETQTLYAHWRQSFYGELSSGEVSVDTTFVDETETDCPVSVTHGTVNAAKDCVVSADGEELIRTLKNNVI